MPYKLIVQISTVLLKVCLTLQVVAVMVAVITMVITVDQVMDQVEGLTLFKVQVILPVALERYI